MTDRNISLVFRVSPQEAARIRQAARSVESYPGTLAREAVAAAVYGGAQHLPRRSTAYSQGDAVALSVALTAPERDIVKGYARLWGGSASEYVRAVVLASIMTSRGISSDRGYSTLDLRRGDRR